jgi:hypothetical protein
VTPHTPEFSPIPAPGAILAHVAQTSHCCIFQANNMWWGYGTQRSTSLFIHDLSICGDPTYPRGSNWCPIPAPGPF